MSVKQEKSNSPQGLVKKKDETEDGSGFGDHRVVAEGVSEDRNVEGRTRGLRGATGNLQRAATPTGN